MPFNREVVLSMLAGLVTTMTVGVPPSRAATPFPLQLELRVPFEPSAFPSNRRTFLCYELYLTNFAGSPINLRRLEVVDDDDKSAKPVASFEGGQLEALLQIVGPGVAAGTSPSSLAGGSTAVAFMWVSFESGARVPKRLRHRVFTADSEGEGATIGTHHDELKVLGPPVEGTDWRVSDGPSNDPDNHHRRGIIVVEGRPQISRRYAVDWIVEKNGAMFSGDEHANQSYYAYGKPVLAVANAIVVTARDGLPDNVPGYHGEQFHPAIPITPDSVAGNTITLDLGNGQFAQYAHLQPGSLRVKTGDRVRRGQVMARIGASGDARGPHLHFQLTTTVSRDLIAGEGLPYLIDRYRVKSADGVWTVHMSELPLGGTLVDFDQE